MTARKSLLCIDFDGVIHSYSSGWTSPTTIADPPVPGAMDFLREATEHFRVAIFSSRSGETGGVEAMKNWLKDYASQEHSYFAWVHDIEWPTKKPPAFVTLDDRAITFKGHWPTMEFLQAFKPWNKR